MLDLYGKRARKRYKTFVATWRPAGGAIRVVLVDEPSGWVAFVCTNVSANVAEILSTVADRFSLETTYRDCKEIVGAGQQQVRFVWANIGAFNACLWTFTLTKAWARCRGVDELVDRSEFRGTHDPKPPREPRGQAWGAVTGAAGGGHSCGSTPRGERRRNPGRLRTAAQLGRTILKEPTKSGDAHIWLKCVLDRCLSMFVEIPKPSKNHA